MLSQLESLNLTTEEAKIYLELLREPTTHARLAHATGINRTKIYRLADQLEKRSLITTRVDDQGSFLVAADPSTLEVELVTQEEKTRDQRRIFDELLPALSALKEGKPRDFSIYTYDGVEGFKQMLWHELKAKGENLILGTGIIEELVESRSWAEKHRAMTIEVGYTVRQIVNEGTVVQKFTDNLAFFGKYVERILPVDTLPFEQQTVVYNDTVAVYHWRKKQKVGFEVVNAGYATMMRVIFESYWAKASPSPRL